jgi:hypothetical protein
MFSISHCRPEAVILQDSCSMHSGIIEIWNSDSNDHSVIKHEGDGYFDQRFVISSGGTRIATVYDSALLSGTLAAKLF